MPEFPVKSSTYRKGNEMTLHRFAKERGLASTAKLRKTHMTEYCKGMEEGIFVTKNKLTKVVSAYGRKETT